ncbi:MAG: CARDB domain-containing protein [Chloroflexota bacterium]
MFKQVSSVLVAAGLSVSAILAPSTSAPAQAAALPDLVVSRTGATSASPGQSFSFKMKLENAGKIATARGQGIYLIGLLPHGFKIVSVQDTSSDFDCRFDNAVQIGSEPDVPVVACGSLTPFAAGGSLIVQVNAIAPKQTGTYHIDVEADHDNDVPESKEHNNSLHTTFTVH